jgi:short-subunit dehydrogenase involved in D-alanine esterification of teichoic acids
LDLELIVIISNTVLVLGTFIATLYRIKIERDQIKTVKLDVKAKECLTELRKYIKTERHSLIEMDKKELKSFIDYLEKLGKN